MTPSLVLVPTSHFRTSQKNPKPLTRLVTQDALLLVSSPAASLGPTASSQSPPEAASVPATNLSHWSACLWASAITLRWWPPLLLWALNSLYPFSFGWLSFISTNHYSVNSYAESRGKNRDYSESGLDHPNYKHHQPEPEPVCRLDQVGEDEGVKNRMWNVPLGGVAPLQTRERFHHCGKFWTDASTHLFLHSQSSFWSGCMEGYKLNTGLVGNLSSGQ